MTAPQATAQLVGRVDELFRLRVALESARTGVTTTVFINGESGVGKSRLLAELAAIARSQQVTVLTGAAVEGGEETPFWPIRDALHGLLNDPTNGWALEAVDEWSGDLANALPGVRTLPKPEGREPRGHEPMLDLLFRVVLALSARGPMVVLLDDMHRADRSSRRLLAHLLATLTDEPLLFLISYRADGLGGWGAIHDLALELQRSQRATVLHIPPLDRRAVAELMTAEESHLVETVWRRSGGNAFYVEELVAAIREGSHGATNLPESLQDVIRSRIRTVPESTRSLLRALAVGEEPVAHRLLASVHTAAEDDLLSSLRAAFEADLVVVDSTQPGYRLRHGLLKEIVAADLLPGEVFYLHRRFAEAMEKSSSTDARYVGAMARHWLGAEDWSKSLSYSRAAAQDAERAFAFAEAQEHWMRALMLLGRVEAEANTRASLTERAAEAALLAGDHDQAILLIRQRLAEVSQNVGISANTADLDRARLHDKLGQCTSAAGQTGAAVKAHARAVSLLPASASPEVRATVIAGHAESLKNVGRYGEGMAAASEALKVAESNDLLVVQAQVLPTLGFCLAYLGEPERAVEAVANGLQAALQSRKPDVIAAAHVRRAELLCGPLNRLEAGIEAGRAGADAINDLGLSRTFGVRLQTVMANGLFRMGEWSAAGEVVRAALASSPTGEAAIELRLANCRLLMGQGHLDAAEGELDRVQAVDAESLGSRQQVPLLTLRAGIALWRRQPALAREHVSRGLEIAGGDCEDVWVVAPLVWHGLRAEAELAESARLHSQVVNMTSVTRLRQQMQGLLDASAADDGVRASLLGYLQLCRGEETRAEDISDPEAWARAAATWEANRHPYPTAYAYFRQAEALLYNDARAAGAAAALTKAHSLASAMGANLLINDISNLANRAKVALSPETERQTLSPPDTIHAHSPEKADPARSTSTALASLTPRERDVLREINEGGRTNQQIARRLFISEKTVSVHVSHILAKLGVRSRVQAAMLIERHGTTNDANDQP